MHVNSRLLFSNALSCIAAAVILVAWSVPAAAQRVPTAGAISPGNMGSLSGGGVANTGAPRGAGNAPAGAENAAGLQTAQEVFSNGIQRNGIVGQTAKPPVGANAASAAGQQAAGGPGGGRAGGLGGFGGGGGGGAGGLGAAFGNLFGNQNAQSGSNSTPPIRTRLRMAIQPNPITTLNLPDRNVAATMSLQRLPTMQPSPVSVGGYQSTEFTPHRFNRVRVQIQDRKAVLTGEVAQESDRRMSHLMMRLQPGVSTVENRIRLQPE